MEGQNMAEKPVEETVESQLEVETEEQEQAETQQVRRYLDDFEFYQICEEVVNGDNPTKEAIAERTGLTVSTVTQRRHSFNKEYGPEFRLTDLPKGGRRKNTQNVLSRLRAMKAEAESNQETGEASESEA
jgi:hypothetical protein